MTVLFALLPRRLSPHNITCWYRCALLEGVPAVEQRSGPLMHQAKTIIHPRFEARPSQGERRSNPPAHWAAKSAEGQFTTCVHLKALGERCEPAAMLHTECLSLPRSVVRPLSSFLCCPNQLQLTSKSCSRLHTLRGHSRLPLCYFRSCSSAYKASVRCSSSAKVDMGITSGADDVAIVLVDHGSRRAEANAMLEDFADLYRFAHLPPSIPRVHIQDVLAYR